MDLKLVDSDDLIAELASRWDASVFTGVKLLTAKKEERYIDYRGGLTTCRGLVKFAESYLEQEAMK